MHELAAWQYDDSQTEALAARARTVAKDLDPSGRMPYLQVGELWAIVVLYVLLSGSRHGHGRSFLVARRSNSTHSASGRVGTPLKLLRRHAGHVNIIMLPSPARFPVCRQRSGKP
jgi:predicted hotdog family 3-hydroxylacyl-ACP dehydratase